MPGLLNLILTRPDGVVTSHGSPGVSTDALIHHASFPPTCIAFTDKARGSATDRGRNGRNAPADIRPSIGPHRPSSVSLAEGPPKPAISVAGDPGRGRS